MSNLKELKAVQSRLMKDRKAAEAEVRKIDSTLQKIDSAIAELQGTGRKESSKKGPKQASKGAVGRRTWTEEQKVEAAERMKKIWAKKKRAKARAAKEDVQAEEAGGRPVVVPPQAVA